MSPLPHTTTLRNSLHNNPLSLSLLRSLHKIPSTPLLPIPTHNTFFSSSSSLLFSSSTMPMVAGTGETTTTMMKRGMKPFIHGVPITTTAAAAASTAPPHPPPEQEHLPCPRCDSTNTKFCYYNNYNFSQPRHFCKSCRRYWTHGGTLRDIPVGGGTRKTAKRCRTSITTTSTPTPNTSSSSSPAADIPVCSSAGGGGDQVGKANFFWAMGGPFTSLLSNPGPGLGFVPGIEDVGFGLGRGFWPLQVVEDGSGGGNHTGGGGAVGMGGITGGNPWQFESGESGFGSDCLSWPDLSISTLGNGLK